MSVEQYRDPRPILSVSPKATSTHGRGSTMKLADALRVCRENRQRTGNAFRVVLASGCAPHHLQTLLEAHLAQRVPERRIVLTTGLFGDLIGTLENAAASGVDGAAPEGFAVLLEWSDLDARLGWRALSRWGRSQRGDITECVSRSLTRLQQVLEGLADRQMPVVLSGPHIEMPPVSQDLATVRSHFELGLEAELTAFRAALSASGVRISALRPRQDGARDSAEHDLRSELNQGFPYDLHATSDIAAHLASLIAPPAPKKGLIVDLDETLWKGIVADLGPEGVQWTLEHGAQLQGLFQLLVSSLSEDGVLVGVASKNDPDLVQQVLSRNDLRLDPAQLFPVHASWRPKSESVKAILSSWNVGPEAVVFVDDSPLELEEVARLFPSMECLRFPANDVGKGAEFLWRVSALFGRSTVHAEDLLRRESLRSREAIAPTEANVDADSFLHSLDARVTCEWSQALSDKRALELVNKTNQFNLNGRRYTETSWRELLRDPHVVTLVTSYDDKYGPLGKIGVLVARLLPADAMEIVTWVLSCRAFSRRVEYRMLNEVIARFPVERVLLNFVPTDRNHLVLQCLSGLGAEGSREGLVLASSAFYSHLPSLYQKVVHKSEG